MDPTREGALEGMETRLGETGVLRLVVVTLAALSLMLVAALAAPLQEADAHQIAGRTLIYIDGELVKKTQDDHFTFERRLSRGCHTVKVVQRQGGDVTTQQTSRVCSDDGSRVVVEVDDNNVRTRVST